MLNIIFFILIFLICIFLFQNYKSIKALNNLSKIKNDIKAKNLYLNDISGIIILLIVIILFIPYLFTRSVFSDFNFSETGQIGDTLGGITSPFINGLSAILVFIAFKEQKRSNDILVSEINSQKIKDENEYIKIKNLILYDMEFRIKPSLNYLISEIPKSIEEIENKNITYYKDYVDLNDFVFKSNNINSYLHIFNKKESDFSKILNIYNRINFIYKHTPLQISYKYPRDKNSLVYIGYSKKRRKKTIKRHIEKTKIELNKLTSNTADLISNIDDFLSRYKNHN